MNQRSSRDPWAAYLLTLSVLLWLTTHAISQTTSTWVGGAGSWSPCPPGGNAQWNTCGDNPPAVPNGNFDAVISGGPVSATSASVVNLTINSGGSLVFPPNTPTILDITGSSMVNNGSIMLAGTDGLGIIGPATVTLSGSGSVTMAGNNFTGSGNPTLILEQPVEGQGVFARGLSLTNKSVINATGGTLSMQPTSVTNTGIMKASSGGTLAFTNGAPVTYNNTGGTIQALSGGAVQLDGGIYSGGTLSTTGTGLIQANGEAVLNALSNTGTVKITAAALQGTVTNNGAIEILSATLSMTGNVTLAGSGSVLMSGTGVLNQLDGTDTLTNKQLIHGAGRIYELPLTNHGTVAADSTGNTLAIAGGKVTNTSKLQASGGGTLELDTVVNNSGGIIEALNGSTVLMTNNFNGSVNGGILTTAGTGVIESQNAVLDGTVNIPTNAGILKVDNFNLALQGTINNTGNIVLSGNSCVELNQPTTLTGSGTLIMASTTCIYGSGRGLVNESTIEGAGSIGDSNPMPITNKGTIIANQSSPLLIVPDATGFTNDGKLIANLKSTLDIRGSFNGLSSAGTLAAGTYSVTGTLGLPGSVMTNAANIALTGTAAEILNTNSSTNALSALAANTATGSLALQAGQTLTTSTSLTNAGRVTVGSASDLTVGGSYTQSGGTTTVDGTLRAPKGLALRSGILAGQGTIAAAVTSAGAVIAGDSTTKAGKLSIAGSYTQEAGGALELAIGGLPTGTYSHLAVSNGISLNGTLNIKLINGFVPAVGDVYTILTGSAVSGRFATVNGLPITSSEHFEIKYTSTAVTLTAASGA